jgi:hypothetical protein
MDNEENRLGWLREAAGVLLIAIGILGSLAYLLVVGGPVVTLVAVAGAGLAALGYMLASGTPSESEGDFEPVGPGPLWQDPEDPQSFIPRA